MEVTAETAAETVVAVVDRGHEPLMACGAASSISVCYVGMTAPLFAEQLLGTQSRPHGHLSGEPGP
jgi:hypothetical protein